MLQCSGFLSTDFLSSSSKWYQVDDVCHCFVQVGDAMTALLHVVEVMKFLEMLILRNLRKRVEVAASDLQQANSLDFEVGPHVLKDEEIPESDCGGVVLLDGLERQSSGPIDNNLLMDFEYYNSNNPTVVVKKHSRRRRAKKGRVHQNGTDTDNGNVESWYTKKISPWQLFSQFLLT